MAGVELDWELWAIDPVPDQGPAELEAGCFIIPGGPALLYVL